MKFSEINYISGNKTFWFHGLILLRLAPHCLRVYRNSWVHQGAFSLHLQKHPWSSLSINFTLVPLTLLRSSCLFSSLLSDWIAREEWRGQKWRQMWTNVQVLCVFTDDLAISYFWNPCSSWTRLSFSVEEWDPNSMVLNFLAGHRIPWILKKALDLLPRNLWRSCSPSLHRALPEAHRWRLRLSLSSPLALPRMQPLHPVLGLSEVGPWSSGTSEHWGWTTCVQKAKPPVSPLHPPLVPRISGLAVQGPEAKNSCLSRGPFIGIHT